MLFKRKNELDRSVPSNKHGYNGFFIEILSWSRNENPRRSAGEADVQGQGEGVVRGLLGEAEEGARWCSAFSTEAALSQFQN